MINAELLLQTYALVFSPSFFSRYTSLILPSAHSFKLYKTTKSMGFGAASAPTGPDPVRQ